ncbi:heterokaryon incompatibility protein-domain-containing protein [Diaporthe sp. PMI_573]|nr:heterokaryon incompatibility protein-domain-containing protein [Diaporthaceae sp. PMI_573]
MRCELCQNLTLNHLVALAEKEFSSQYGFPSSNFYQHHKSVHDLEQSKQTGCDLCSIIWEALQRANSPSIEDLRAQDVSDIRIAITSGHVPSNTYDTSDVRMFDFLSVQAGDKDDAIHRASLSLLSHPGTEIGRFKIGRHITDPDLRAPSNFGIVQKWLQQCCSEHMDCPSLQQGAPLPKRVVDVGGIGTGGVEVAPFLFVSDDDTPAKGRYAALSHCWGGPIDVVLTQDKLEAFQRRLPVESLARNFQDALRICRELGVRYLWVDSLCIVQDSRDDWAAESSKMASIYSNAFVTISAMSSPGSSKGIFGETNTADTRDPTLSRAVTLKLSPESEEVIHALPAKSQDDPEDLASLYQEAPLALRAWTLQETILSPRLIYYGKDRIYWRCFAGFQSADGVPDGFQFPDNRDIRLASALQGLSEVAICPPRDRWGLGQDKGDHYDLVEQYTSRNLTVPSDKLPAFSGLAERIHASLGGGYLAGLFTEDLQQGLLWKTTQDFDDIDTETTKDGEDGTSLNQYRAPSWSWASKDRKVDFKGNFMTDVSPRQQLKLRDSHIRYQDARRPYGEVLPGSYIVVTGLARRLVLSKQAHKGWQGHVGGGAEAMRRTRISWDDHRRQPRESSQNLFAVPVSPPQESEEEDTAESATEKQGPSFFVVMEDKAEPKSEEWSKEWMVLPELFTRDEFILLMVRNFWDWDDEDGEYGRTDCMIVEKIDDGPHTGLTGSLQGPLYRRAGIISLDDFGEAVGWEEMTLTII